MRVLVVGLGAIGQRHARNLRALRPGVELHALRRRRLPHVITEKLERDDSRDVEVEFGLTVHETLDEALAAQPTAVFICTPSSLHMEVALAAAEAGCHIFIEKPVSHSLDGLDRLQRIADDRELVVAVGCQWRFHPGVTRLRELLHAGSLGVVRQAEIQYAEYLPDWHPYEDYRLSYAARAELGGGVVLTQIHDYDLAWWLFGAIRSVSATGGKLSDLEMDVEDTVLARLETEAGPLTVSQTFAKRPPHRSIVIQGSNATAALDLLGGRLVIQPPIAEGLAIPDYPRNEMFRSEVEDFLSCMETGAVPRSPLSDGAAVLRVALAVKESLLTGRAVPLG